MDRKVVYLHASHLEENVYPESCPFNSSRGEQTRCVLSGMGLLGGAGRSVEEPKPAQRQTIERFHKPIYLDAIKSAAEGDLDADSLHMGLGTPDCPVFPQMYDHSLLVCGASLGAASLLIEGKADVVFNPLGGMHHAHSDRAGGFCYMNDIVIACMALADQGMKVLFLDVDAHHCDGVQDAFYERNDIVTMSFHESPKTLFPGTGFENEIGRGEGKGFCVNVPLPAGIYDDAYIKAFNEIGIPLIGAYAPDVIVLELGMDGLAGDPLTHMQLTNNAYAKVVKEIMAFEKPILATGGGGYNVENTVRGWARMWAVFCEEDCDEDSVIGLGGVMLQSTDWQAGLRDRVFNPAPEQCQIVDQEVAKIIEMVKQNVFSLHGL